MSDSLAGKRIAIANRGEIAVRIATTCRRLGAIPIALLGVPDRDGYAARQIGRVQLVGEAGSELDVALVIAAAQRTKADYLHPGYGFLSERETLATACGEAGITFVGPSPETLRICGDKLATRAAAERAGAPLLPASPPLTADPETWIAEARRVGYPLLVKPAGAGGGRGLRQVAVETGLIEAVSASRRESASSGAGDAVYLERALIAPRHVEVQVAGDGTRAVALGDRDCSLQRRHQKVIEEAPAPELDDHTRRALHDHARRIAEAVQLRGIATCEFLLGADGTLAFLEVNPRIQVEHPVTELVTGIDLVEWQLLIASGASLPLLSPPEPRGHAIEARVYAEDPQRGFFPVAGKLTTVSWPVGPGIRVDTGYAQGDDVATAYDAMLAKVIALGSNRQTAIAALRLALLDTVVAGLPTNLPWLLNLIDTETFQAGEATTRTAAEIAPALPDRQLALLAATAWAIAAKPSTAGDPWSAIGPFRLSGGATLTFHGDDWEERIIVTRGTAGWEATIGDATCALHFWQGNNGVWTIAAGEQVAKLAVTEWDGTLEITGNGGRWLIRSGARPIANAAKREQASDGRVRAPLPGKVLRIHVTEGDQVEAGQPVVSLSAMKMELVCAAPVAGIVATVSCRVDEIVTADQVLAEIRLEP